MQNKEEQQKIFDLGIARGVEIYKKAVLEMLYEQLDLEGDPTFQCPQCAITKRYIDVLEGNIKDEQ